MSKRARWETPPKWIGTAVKCFGAGGLWSLRVLTRPQVSADTGPSEKFKGCSRPQTPSKRNSLRGNASRARNKHGCVEKRAQISTRDLVLVPRRKSRLGRVKFFVEVRYEESMCVEIGRDEAAIAFFSSFLIDGASVRYFSLLQLSTTNN